MFGNNCRAPFIDIDQLKQVKEDSPRLETPPVVPRYGRKLVKWDGTMPRERRGRKKSPLRWSPAEMFKANARLGVRSTFAMSHYTNVDVDATGYSEK